ncbi:MAG: YdaU family protein [Pseudomonadales bacterium]|nr:YdaU family protein [Pseudomonadales bacterium]
MHHYQFNIGDYRKDTAHLSLLEHGIYRMLIDSYYTNEGPLEADDAKLMRTHCIRSADEQQAYRNVMDDFFDLVDGRYVHAGCDKVLAKIYEKSAKAKESAEKRWANKNKGSRVSKEEKNANAMRTHSERNANGMLPITHNPIPNTDSSNELSLSDLFSQLWESWPSGHGEKGSRKNAESAFLKLKPDKTLFTTMIAARDAQARDKQFRVSQGQFASPFQHVERWIKNRRWEDEIGNQVTPGYSSGSVTDQSTVGKAAAAAERKRQEILARNGGGSGTGDGGPVGAYGGAVRGQVVEAIR